MDSEADASQRSVFSEQRDFIEETLRLTNKTYTLRWDQQINKNKERN